MYHYSFFFIFSLFFILLTNASSAKEIDNLGPSYSRYKLGVLVYNSKFQIYRSGALGKRGLRKVKSYLQKRSMLFPKTIIYMNKAGYKFPFYYALDEYHLQKKYGLNFIIVLVC